MSSKSKNKVQLYLKGLFHNKKFSRQQKHHYATGRFLDLFESFIKRNRPDLFIWESRVGYYLLLSDILKKYQIPTIALPHNLESLVTGSQNIFNLKPSPIWLNEEIGHLRNCNCIFTMSREESWLLSAFGLNSICLPYYPPRNTEASLKAIREKRKERPFQDKRKKDILLLGTYHNRPTAEGYIIIINELKSRADYILHIAGFGSKSLQHMFPEDNVRFWGEVSTEDLAQLMILCDCAVIHQQPTSGSLTRIPEMLIAGIPVLANIHASRSCNHLKGVSVYHNTAELLDLLKRCSSLMPPLLQHPVEELLFVENVIKNAYH